jgi:hypothetical protein
MERDTMITISAQVYRTSNDEIRSNLVTRVPSGMRWHGGPAAVNFRRARILFMQTASIRLLGGRASALGLGANPESDKVC